MKGSIKYESVIVNIRIVAYFQQLRSEEKNMSSPRTGAVIDAEEAKLLLHRWIDDSTKIRALFASGSIPGLTFTLVGFLATVPDTEVVSVTQDGSLSGPHLRFDPTLATLRTYGDDRAFGPPPPEMAILARPPAEALAFVFGDASQIAIFEVIDPI